MGRLSLQAAGAPALASTGFVSAGFVSAGVGPPGVAGVAGSGPPQAERTSAVKAKAMDVRIIVSPEWELEGAGVCPIRSMRDSW
jgi:hypothetical protein